MNTDDIRKTFLEFFKSKGHTIVPSDSLVPKDDPTLLFTGAGMNQFKEKFLGRNVTYKRAASSQKCLRTGDLENVGKTTSHHTFFEMLGNFSFGDYFKKEAIGWAWEYFTKILKIQPEKLWASVYKDDEEAYLIWKDIIKIPADRIMKFGEKDNFWPSEAPTNGPNGPCGPCSEIFYDYGKDVGCGEKVCDPSCSCGRFVEVWNMVFTQYDRQADGSLKPLPAKNIDTGMGLERLASVMQGVKTNFEIDIFVPLVSEIEKGCRVQGVGSRAKINAIADHIRAVTFMIGDGVMPSNEEHGYVVRKLIRLASKYAGEIGIKEPFLYKLVSTVCHVMGSAYPELKAKRDDIADVVKMEEENFLNIVQTQLPKVKETFKNIANEKMGSDAVIAGTNSAFIFSDTHGVPFETCEASAKEYGIELDKNRFEKLRDEQRIKSRARTKIKSEIFSETFAKKVEALGLKTEFLGYEKSHAEAKVLVVMDGGEIILDRTPFYGESGGQVGDWGRIESASGAMEIEDAKRIGDTIVHIGTILRGRINKGDTVKAEIDDMFRKKVASNHTATHLLQAALRKVLGEHVKQTGSMVDAEHLRFDFTHMKKMEDREIARVEKIVNENIDRALAVRKQIMDIESARKEGAMALFGEKYGDKVRVVSVGDISKELCGGSHTDNSKEIGIFRITSERSIASGVRRIEAVTGEAAEKWIAKKNEDEEKKRDAEICKQEEKKVFALRLKEASEKLDAYILRAKTLAGSRIVCEVVDGLSIEGLRILSDKLREREKSAVVIFAAKAEGKASFIVSVTDDLVKKKVSAGEIAKSLAGLIAGSGGGRPNFAQGGGKSLEKLAGAIDKIVEMVKEKLK